MAEYKKPLPIPDEDTKEFWEGCKRHELLLQKCDDCGAFRFPPRILCDKCMSMNFKWVKASGKGKVYTFSIIYQPFGPGWEVPYTVALIELEEGVKMMSNVVECKPEDVKIGMEVEVCFDDVTDKITLPKFKPYKGA